MLSIIYAFIISSVTLISLYPAAIKFGFVDRPCNRKRHQGNIPFIGNLQLFYGDRFGENFTCKLFE